MEEDSREEFNNRIRRSLTDWFGSFEEFHDRVARNRQTSRHGLIRSKMKPRPAPMVSLQVPPHESPSHIPVHVALQSMRNLVEEPLSALPTEFADLKKSVSAKNSTKRKLEEEVENHVDVKRKKETNMRNSIPPSTPDSGVHSTESDQLEEPCSDEVVAMLNIMKTLDEPKLSPIPEYLIKEFKKEKSAEKNQKPQKPAVIPIEKETKFLSDSSMSSASTSREQTPEPVVPGSLKLKGLKPDRVQKLLDLAKSRGKLVDQKDQKEQKDEGKKQVVEKLPERVPEKAVEKPAERPAEKPVEKERPVERIPERPQERIPDRHRDRNSEKERSDRHGERSLDRPSDRHSDRPSERSSDRPSDKSSDRPSDRPSDRSSDRPKDRDRNSERDRPPDRRLVKERSTDKPGKSDRSDRSERSERPERSERSDRSDKPERSEKHEKSERSDKSDKRKEKKEEPKLSTSATFTSLPPPPRPPTITPYVPKIATPKAATPVTEAARNSPIPPPSQQKPPNKTVQNLQNPNSTRNMSPSPQSIRPVTPTVHSRPSSSLSVHDNQQQQQHAETATSTPTKSQRWACQWDHKKLKTIQRVPIPDPTTATKTKGEFYRGLAKEWKSKADASKDRVLRPLHYMLSSVYFILEATWKTDKDRSANARMQCSSIYKDTYELLGVAVFQSIRDSDDPLATHMLPRIKVLGQIMLSVMQYQQYLFRADQAIKAYSRLEMREVNDSIDIRSASRSSEASSTHSQSLMVPKGPHGNTPKAIPSAGSTPSGPAGIPTPWIVSVQTCPNTVTMPQIVFDSYKSQLKTSHALILASRYWEDSKALARLVDATFIRDIETVCGKSIGMDMPFDVLAQFVLTAVGSLKEEYEEEQKQPLKPAMTKVKKAMEYALMTGTFHTTRTAQQQPQRPSQSTPKPNQQPQDPKSRPKV